MASEAHFLDVGQGDCTYLRLPEEQNVLVDCNIEGAAENVVEYLKGLDIRTLHHLVITHPDWDHMSGLELLAQNFEIAEVWDNNYEHDTDEHKDYRSILRNLERNGTTIINPRAGDRHLTPGSLPVIVLSPYEKYSTNLNNASIVFKVVYGQVSFLFGADCEKERWEEILEYFKEELPSALLHASHHGSDNGCHEEAVKIINPEIVIISVGENDFGHPGDDALEIYEKYSDVIYRTDEEGTIILTTDGTSIQNENIRLAESMVTSKPKRSQRLVDQVGRITIGTAGATFRPVRNHRFYGE